MKWQLKINGVVVAEWFGDLRHDDPGFPEIARRHAVIPGKDYQAAREDGSFSWGCSGACELREVPA